MADFLSVSILGNQAVAARLKGLPSAAINAGVESATELIAERLNRYSNSAPYNYVPFAAVGGFYSDRQRAFVMAGIREGRINPPYSRTAANRYSVTGSGKDRKVVSDKISMFYSMSDQGQARLQNLRGWGKVGDILNANNADIVKAFDLGVKDAITNMDRQFSESMASVAP